MAGGRRSLSIHDSFCNPNGTTCILIALLHLLRIAGAIFLTRKMGAAGGRLLERGNAPFSWHTGPEGGPTYDCIY